MESITDQPVERDGRLHPANGYILVEAQEAQGELIVIRDPSTSHFECGVVVEMSGDSTDDDLDMGVNDFDWKKGDLVYFCDSIEVAGRRMVHWTDVVAFKRF